MGAILDGREHRIRVPRVTATSGIDLSTAKLRALAHILSTAKLPGSGTHSVMLMLRVLPMRFAYLA